MSILDDFEEGEIKEESTLARKINTAQGELFTSLKEVAEHLGAKNVRYYQVVIRPLDSDEMFNTTRIYQIDYSCNSLPAQRTVGYICNSCDGIRLGTPEKPQYDGSHAWSEHTCATCHSIVGNIAIRKYEDFVNKK